MSRKSIASSAARRKVPVRRSSTTPSAASSRASDATGASWQAPLGLATAWTQFAQQMQHAGAQSWQDLQRDAALQADDVRHADTPQQLAGVPIGFASEQATRWAQWATQVAAGLLDVQAAWLKQCEAAAAQWLAPLFSQDGRIALGSAQDVVEPPTPDTPMHALRSAQALWSESAKVWLNAMSHDLQADPARPR